jgi:HD-GYP domain-containing protein (c-di-GMP phosphodiesterase class II)/DNA-binding CsgD family transcriptional regulator
MVTAGPSHVRLAEIIAALSLATDLGMGQPMEQALRTCLLSVAAGRQLGVDEETLSDIYYLALLRFVGCTADAHEEAAAVGGDDIADRAIVAPVIMGDMGEFLGHYLPRFAPGRGLPARLVLLARYIPTATSAAKRAIAFHCEVAQMLAQRLDVRPSVAPCVGHLFERWDGKGIPGELAGGDIPIPARVVAVARDVDVLYGIGGWEHVEAMLRRRRATSYDPAVVDIFCAQGERWLSEAGEPSVWESALAAEPGSPVLVGRVRLDGLLHALADFADLKSPSTLGHSAEVARLAEGAARSMGLSDDEAIDVRRAALVHDLGRTGVPNGIWDKRGRLSASEWERVRLHPYYSERILARTTALAHLASPAGSHHERLDGSGYHRGSPAALLTAGARILAAADAYQAMTQERPYRQALSAKAAAMALQGEADAARLDRRAVRAVIESAGLQTRTVRHVWPAGLTEREVEVLRLISRGHSNRVVAQHLGISAKTAGRHVENLYAKIGVSSRAAAALYAVEHDLLGG